MSKTMREIVAETRWEASADFNGVFLYGDDITHDVALKVTGDFSTSTEHLAYAQALADRLNGGAE